MGIIKIKCPSPDGSGIPHFLVWI